MIHKGIRPTYELSQTWMSHEDTEGYGRTFHKKRYLETFPDGSGRYWNDRMLNSGCDQEVCGIEENGLIYCEFCDEWFNKEQFNE